MKIKSLVIVLSAAVLASCGTTVNLATYNVCGFHHSKTNSMEMVASMMKEWRPDAISINELDSAVPVQECGTMQDGRKFRGQVIQNRSYRHRIRPFSGFPEGPATGNIEILNLVRL